MAHRAYHIHLWWSLTYAYLERDCQYYISLGPTFLGPHAVAASLLTIPLSPI